MNIEILNQYKVTTNTELLNKYKVVEGVMVHI